MAYDEEDAGPRRKMPPPRWTDPANAAPPSVLNREVEELKEERERIKSETEPLRQQDEQDTERKERRRHLAGNLEVQSGEKRH